MRWLKHASWHWASVTTEPAAQAGCQGDGGDGGADGAGASGGGGGGEGGGMRGGGGEGGGMLPTSPHPTLQPCEDSEA